MPPARRLARSIWNARGFSLLHRLLGLRAPTHPSAPPPGPAARPLAAFRAGIDTFNASQPNRVLLDSMRSYDHFLIDQIQEIRPLKGSLLLDVGASPHGYALERALEHGATLYVGIGLDIAAPEYVIGETNSVGMLVNMNAEALQFPAAMFDWVISINTFEHVANVQAAFAEIARVLKTGGLALISLEPVWTCSYGHHLHHFGVCAALVPPWAHLRWTRDELREMLADRWPGDVSLTLETALDWVYEGTAINRRTISEFRTLFATGPLAVEWRVDLREDNVDEQALQEAAVHTGLTRDDLTTKGLSVLLRRS